MSRWIGLLLLAACETPIAVQVAVPDAANVLTPVPNVRIGLLPYDRDSLYQALVPNGDSGTHTAAMDTLFQQLGEAYRTMLDARDSLARTRAALALDALQQRFDPLLAGHRAARATGESSAVHRFDSVGLALRWGRVVIDSTGPDGWVSVRRPPGGRWWIVARAINARDPYSEWYWNVPATGDTIRLTPATGRRRPRY